MEAENYKIKLPPKNKEITLKKFSHKGWDFYSHSEYMMNSVDLDLLCKEKDSCKLYIDHLPEVFYGYNRLFLVNKEKNFSYEFNPIQFMALTKYDIRKKLFDDKKIYYVPPEVKVQYHKTWENIKVEGRDDIKRVEPTSDWSFSSPYMGYISSIAKSEISSFYPEIKDDKQFDIKYGEDTKGVVIPIERLSPENKIIEYNQIEFFEDELSDNGISEGKIRFRVMDDCFYGLMRSYLRVDNVIIRNIDTRIYYGFGDEYIIRNISVKEMSYSKLTSMGFSFSNEWNMSPNQSDIVGQYMGKPLFEINDLVYL
jgi:type 2A phosphatase activator TIP41